jgi:catechol-2,3-dioxygenase
MPINRLNHAVLYVRDIKKSVAFYRDVLGFRVAEHNVGPNGNMLQAPGSTNDHDLGLFQIGEQAGPSGAGRTTVGMYHLAWEIDTLDELAAMADRLSKAGALVGASDHSTTKSLYGHDPDGLEFEVCWIVPEQFVDQTALDGRGVEPLDLQKEIARYGGDTLGGVGISRPA